jgi:tetratricopeptide (TPR) repeat protein
MKTRGSKVWTKAAMDIYRVILRNYKDYRRRDEVLFTMGYNLYETGEKPEGVKMYWELIKGFPESRFVPDAYLAMGEHYFNANDVFNAKKAYERALKFKTSKVYTFALYKLAWCDYNLGDYDRALEKFQQVVVEAEAERQRGGDKNKIQLKREALQDMILAFSQVDALDVAKDYYNSTVGTRETKMYMRKLAKTYEKQGKAEMTVKSFRMLLNEYPDDPEAPRFHNSIVLAYRKMNARDKVKREVNRLIDQYKPGSRWAEINKGNQMAIKKANALVEESLRDLVTAYHKEAQETKYWDTYNLARGIYAKYLDTFPESEYAYKLSSTRCATSTAPPTSTPRWSRWTPRRAPSWTRPPTTRFCAGTSASRCATSRARTAASGSPKRARRSCRRRSPAPSRRRSWSSRTRAR